MISKRPAKYLFFGTFLGVLLIPAMAFAQEAARLSPPPWPTPSRRWPLHSRWVCRRSGAGWAQARIGSAGQGTLAERPEERVFVLTLTALPEVIALLGFVMAIILNG